MAGGGINRKQVRDGHISEGSTGEGPFPMKRSRSL
jgi:hypothetical protein